MFLRIENIPQKKLIGQRANTSFSDNKTFQLWKGFMPRRNEIKGRLGNDLFSIQVFESVDYFNSFDPNTVFEKWAAAEVTDFIEVPRGMETFVLPSGSYAVFLHKGPASTGPKTFQYIFATWLPVSAYALDDRPHFEILGAKYKNDDPDSEEEIWIPIKKQ